MNPDDFSPRLNNITSTQPDANNTADEMKRARSCVERNVPDTPGDGGRQDILMALGLADADFARLWVSRRHNIKLTLDGEPYPS